MTAPLVAAVPQLLQHHDQSQDIRTPTNNGQDSHPVADPASYNNPQNSAPAFVAADRQQSAPDPTSDTNPQSTNMLA